MAMSPFSKLNPNLQLYWDSTSLGWLKRCPRLYYYQMILGFQPSGKRDPLEFGILYHSSLEVYDKLRADGFDHKPAQFAAVRYALDNSVEHFAIKTCGNCGLQNSEDADFCKACSDDLPEEPSRGWEPKTGLLDNRRTREILVRSIVWYTEEYKNDQYEVIVLRNGNKAVELSFRFGTGIGTADGEEFFLSGHMDRVVRYKPDDSIWVMDRKTTGSTLYSSFFDGFSPHNQMSIYTLASKLVFDVPAQGVIIEGVQLAVGFCRFDRGSAPRNPDQLDEFYNDLTMWLGLAEQFATQNHWPMNEEACGMYGGCPFRKVCSKSPSVREKYLEADFKHRPWNPLETR
jgi:RecB family exonuclease